MWPYFSNWYLETKESYKLTYAAYICICKACKQITNNEINCISELFAVSLFAFSIFLFHLICKQSMLMHHKYELFIRINLHFMCVLQQWQFSFDMYLYALILNVHICVTVCYMLHYKHVFWFMEKGNFPLFHIWYMRCCRFGTFFSNHKSFYLNLITAMAAGEKKKQRPKSANIIHLVLESCVLFIYIYNTSSFPWNYYKNKRWMMIAIFFKFEKN